MKTDWELQRAYEYEMDKKLEEYYSDTPYYGYKRNRVASIDDYEYNLIDIYEDRLYDK